MKKFGLVTSLCLVLISLLIFPTYAGSGKITQGMQKGEANANTGAPSCFITDTAGNIVTDVSLSSIFSNDHQMYYLWYSASSPSFNQKFILSFDSDGFGLSKMIQKMNYGLASGNQLALAFAITPENTSLGTAKFKVKTDTEACTHFFNVVP